VDELTALVEMTKEMECLGVETRDPLGGEFGVLEAWRCPAATEKKMKVRANTV
jgi:hypothetical protein